MCICGVKWTRRLKVGEGDGTHSIAFQTADGQSAPSNANSRQTCGTGLSQEKAPEEYEQEAEKAKMKNPARQRLLLAHVSVDDKYGMIFDQEEVNVVVFIKQDAHKQWLRLVEIMEENAERGDVLVEAVSNEQNAPPKTGHALRERC